MSVPCSATLPSCIGDYERSFETAQRGLDIDASVSGPDHPDVGLAWLNLARSSDKLGDERLALEQVDRAIEIFGRRFPPGHPLRIQAANFRAGFLIQMGRLADARKTLESSTAGEAASVETKRSVLSGRIILAEIELLETRLQQSEELARSVLADPAARGDRRLEADAHWAHAYALGMQANMQEAETERTRALEIETAMPQGAFPGVFAHAKYYVCAGVAARALAMLREAVAKGFHDPIVLNDPTFATLRKTPDFAPIAAAVTPRVRSRAATR
jgi:tetratricopeptide (TPR) repeat protein